MGGQQATQTGRRISHTALAQGDQIARAGVRPVRAPRSDIEDKRPVYERVRHWMLPGLCLLAFGLRVVGLDYQSLWRDEVDAIRFASRPIGGLLRTFVTPAENGPLYYLLLGRWLALVGQSEYALRFTSVLCGVLTVPLVHRLGGRLFPSQPALPLVAALVTACSPYLVWYSQEGKMYMFVVLLVLISADRLATALEKGGWYRWLGYVVVTSAALYVHLLSILMLPVHVAVFGLQDRGLRRERWKPWALSLAALTVPYLPLLAWQLPMLLRPAETGFAFLPLPQMLFSLFANYSLGVTAAVPSWSLVPFAVLLVAAICSRGGHQLELRRLWILLAWLLLPVGSLFLISLNRPLYTARYLAFVVPAYLLLLSLGVVAIGRRNRAAAGLLLAALLAVSALGLWHQASSPIKADLRGATQYVTSHWQADDLVLFQIPYGRHSFDYYLRRQQGPTEVPDQLPLDPSARGHRVFIPLLVRGGAAGYRWAEGLYTNGGREPSEVDQRMAGLVSGSRVVWLVTTEVPLWDQRGLVQAWLGENAVLMDEVQFVRVGVYRYRFP